eukprot:11200609-Lingulodinium_polyedra.AAC.1
MHQGRVHHALGQAHPRVLAGADAGRGGRSIACLPLKKPGQSLLLMSGAVNVDPTASRHPNALQHILGPPALAVQEVQAAQGRIGVHEETPLLGAGQAATPALRDLAEKRQGQEAGTSRALVAL